MVKTPILIFCRYFSPAYKAGGPIVSISNIVEHLGDYFDFYIITSDRDIGDKRSFPNISNKYWHKVGKANVYYLSKDASSFITIIKIIREKNSI